MLAARAKDVQVHRISIFLLVFFLGIRLSIYSYGYKQRRFTTGDSFQHGQFAFVDIRTLNLAHLQIAFSFFLLLYRKILLEEQRVRGLLSPLISRPSTPCSRE